MPNIANEFWNRYRRKIYHTDELPRMQERECSLAFYAGMDAAFRRLTDLSIASEDNDASEREAADACESFRIDIKMATMQVNLDRSNGQS